MNYSYIIIDDDPESVLKTKAIASGFSELDLVATAHNYEDALNLILEHTPKLIFLEIDPTDKNSNLSLNLINALYRYLKVIPKIIITTSKKDLAFEAIQYEVLDYWIKPLSGLDFKKLILKLKKSDVDDEVILIESSHLEESTSLSANLEPISTSKRKNLVLCIKSYGDHRYIDSKDICYFQADNNSTDIHLNNGEVITAFKTLKHFESVLSIPFIRIHNSYIINRNYIARIHTGNSLCYIKNTTVKLPFSKSYKKNIDFIISNFSNENCIEI
jgi:DNA-binding LytR/AlgR family response regulator